MLNAQSGSPAGTVSGVCASSSNTITEGDARADTKRAVRTIVAARGNRRITMALLSRVRMLERERRQSLHEGCLVQRHKLGPGAFGVGPVVDRTVGPCRHVR